MLYFLEVTLLMQITFCFWNFQCSKVLQIKSTWLHKYFTYRNVTYLQWYICRCIPCSDKQYVLLFLREVHQQCVVSRGLITQLSSVCFCMGDLHHCHRVPLTQYLVPSTLLPKPREMGWRQPFKGRQGQMFPSGQAILKAGETKSSVSLSSGMYSSLKFLLYLLFKDSSSLPIQVL